MAGSDDTWKVTIVEQGRDGSVIYHEPGHELHCYWEFGGGDVIAIVTVGRESEWRERHPWTAGRREQILGRIAGEVIRQRAPGNRADFDEQHGAIYLRARDVPVPPGERTLTAAPPPSPPRKPRSKMTVLGLVALVALIALGFGRSLFQIQTTGSPMSGSARVGDTIVTLMTRLEPYVPSLHRDAGKDRYSVGVLVHSARDSTVRRFVPIVAGQQANSLSLSRFIGVDGHLLWFQAPEHGAYDVTEGKIVNPPSGPPEERRTMEDLASGDDVVLMMLIAGGFSSPTRWVGALSEDEATKSFRPGFSITTSYPVQRSKEPRRLYATEIDRVENQTRVRGLEPLGGEGMLNAAFLRDGRNGETLRLTGGGFLLAWESKPYRAGSIMLARVDLAGKVVWTLDTGIGPLRQVLPDSEFPAFIGERPAIPDKVSEPILVVVDASTGRLVTHSLWLK